MRYSMRHPGAISAMIMNARRNRTNPVRTAPASMVLYEAQTFLPNFLPVVRRRRPSVEAPILNAGWIADLNLKSFDEPGFLRECGETVDNSTLLDLRLAAAHRCFAPKLLKKRSALDPEVLDSLSRSLFFQRLMSALGLGSLPPGGLDPVFAQYLFQRWFLSLAAARDDSGGDGDGGLNVFPLQADLLNLTYAMPATVATCTDGQPRTAPVRIDELHQALAEQFLLAFPHRSPALQEWVTAGLIDVFEPTLTRPNLPPQLRYGSLEWALLAIGINLIGMRHWDYSHQELVGLAIAANVFDVDELEPDETDTRAYSRAAVGPVLRMAHAQGKIDLRDADADPAAMLQTAIALFHDSMDERRSGVSIGSVFEALPVRRDVASNMLREHGLDPLRKFSVAKRRGHGRTLLASLEKSLGCMTFEVSYPLVDFFMSDCLHQLLVHGKLPRAYANLLHSTLSKNSHEALNQRFNTEFETAFNALSDNVFSDVLDTSLLTLAPRDRHFWHCGVASVRIPSANILTRIPTRANLGATGVGRPIVSVVKNYAATGGLFVKLTLMENGVSETRDYWVTLEPLTVMGFDGNMGRVLSNKVTHFFQANNPEKESLLSLDDRQTITLEYVEPGYGAAAALTTIQFVARQLLKPKSGPAREMAYQMTAPEISREQLYQSLLDLLPLRACIQSITDGRHYRAAFFCGTDVLSMIPMLRLGGQVVSQATRVGMGVSAARARKLVAGLLTGVIERDIAPQLIAGTLRVGKPLLNLVQHTGRWLNPVDGMASGLSWMLSRVGRGGLQLLKRLRSTPILHRLVANLEHSTAMQRLFYRDGGLWRASPHAALIQADGQRQLQVAGTTYLLANIGPYSDILTIRMGGHSYLVNPENGFAIRPMPDGKRGSDPSALLDSSGTSRAESSPASRLLKDRLCRIKRNSPAGGLETIPCNLIEPAPEFGEGFYQLTSDRIFSGSQARARRPSAAQCTFEMIPVQLNKMGVAPYSMQRVKRTRNRLHKVSNNRYFIFDNNVWIASHTRLTETTMTCPFPDRIRATILGSQSAGTDLAIAADGPYFLGFDIKLPAISGDPLSYYNKFVVPYANYPGKKDECMGIIELPGVAYTFQVKGGWLGLQTPGMRVTLKKAGPEDLGRFEQYRQINLHVIGADDAFDTNTLRQMKHMDMETQRRFDVVFQRVKELVQQASRALERRSPDAQRVLLNFLPERWGFSRTDAFIAALSDNLDDIRTALPIVKKSRYEIIGFGDARRANTNAGPSVLPLPLEEVEHARAEALGGAMRIDMDFAFINKALIYFDKKHFDTAMIDSLASDLIHELSHARFDSRDTIAANSNVMLYPRASMFDADGIDVSSLIALIKNIGAESTNHASTFEHMIMALAYTQSVDTLPLLTNLLNGRKSYGLRRDKTTRCRNSCAILR